MKQTLLIITALMLVFGCSNDGVITEYYKNGQKRSVTTYKDDKEDGLSTWWYENGQKNWEGTLKDGKLDGLYTIWYENGQKEIEGTYKDGELIESTSWDGDGNEW